MKAITTCKGGKFEEFIFENSYKIIENTGFVNFFLPFSRMIKPVQMIELIVTGKIQQKIISTT